jgi:hypothetical protein
LKSGERATLRDNRKPSERMAASGELRRAMDQAVIAKALNRGLIDPAQAERTTPAEAANVIFCPGLSTAEVVSDLSGRGVGMDAVKTSRRDAGGTVPSLRTPASAPRFGSP